MCIDVFRKRKERMKKISMMWPAKSGPAGQDPQHGQQEDDCGGQLCVCVSGGGGGSVCRCVYRRKE